MTYEILYGDKFYRSNMARMLNYPTRRAIIRELEFDEPMTLEQLANQTKLTKNTINNNMWQRMDGIFSFQNEDYPVIGNQFTSRGREFWLEENPLTERILKFVVGEVDKENEKSRELEDLMKFFDREYSYMGNGVGIFLLLREGSMSPDKILQELNSRFDIEIRYDRLAKKLWQSRAIITRVQDINDEIKYSLDGGAAKSYEFLVSPHVGSIDFDS
jgi:hypothetical protein